MAVILTGLLEIFLCSTSLAQTSQNNRSTDSQQWQRRDLPPLTFSDPNTDNRRSITSPGRKATKRLKWKSPRRKDPFQTKHRNTAGKQQQQGTERGSYAWVTPSHHKTRAVVPAEHSTTTRFTGPSAANKLYNSDRLAQKSGDDELGLLEQLEADEKESGLDLLEQLEADEKESGLDLLEQLEADEEDNNLDLLEQLEADKTDEPEIDLNELEDDLDQLQQQPLNVGETTESPEILDDDQQPEFPYELLESDEEEFTIPTETPAPGSDNERDDRDEYELELLQDFPAAEDDRSSIFYDQDGNTDACAQDAVNCQKYWNRVGAHGITTISIDITPPYAPDQLDVKNSNALERDRLAKLAQSSSRVWKDRQGNVVAEGQFVDYGNGHVLIETASESIESLQYFNLSDEDACYVANWWGIPNQCRLSDHLPESRDWDPLTTTWKASALCHKPLYFEQVAVERYGHSFGPVTQPIVSAAHFFGHVATLPYHVGINPPNECRFALGYYRPGNCAPYLFPPLPLSLRGATSQAGAVLGLAYFIP